MFDVVVELVTSRKAIGSAFIVLLSLTRLPVSSQACLVITGSVYCLAMMDWNEEIDAGSVT